MTMINDKLRAAAKRKDLKSILALILLSEGREEDATEMKDASRLTSALIDRTMKDKVLDEEPDYTEIKEQYEGEDEDDLCSINDNGDDDRVPSADVVGELTYADEEVEGLAKKLNKLQKAIASGKAKKAKKILADLVDMGMKGSEMDKLTAQVNELKKDK